MRVDKVKVSKILNLALPAAMNSLLDMINIIVDMIMVGFISSAALAAVGVSMQFLMLNYAFMTIFYVGVGALVSRLYGAGDIKGANIALFNTAIFATLFALPLMLLGLFVNPYFFRWINLSGESYLLGVEYLDILLLALPLMFFRVVVVSSFSAIGDTKTPMKTKIFISFLNFVFDYLLIFGVFGFPEFGIAGAAYSTLIVTILECFIYLYLYFRAKNGLYFIKKFDFSYIKRVLNIGIPTGIERGVTFLGMVVISKFIALYGTSVIAGYQAGLRIEGLAFMPGIGFMVASMALMGQSLGMKNVKEARSQTYLTLFMGATIMGVIGVFMALFSESLSRVFSSDQKTVIASSIYLQIIGLSQIPLAFVFILEGALRGAGATRVTLLVNIIGLWGVRLIPIYLLATNGFDYFWLFLVFFLETYIRAIVFWILFKRGVWIGIKV